MDNEKWRSKAGAFVIRSMHKLWGKNNEDILSYIFKTGFKNSFVKEVMFGINKKQTTRSSDTWGIISDSEKIFINPGIVIPDIVDKKLKKVVVFDHEGKSDEKIQIVSGSSFDPIIKKNNNKSAVITGNIIDAFLLLQELSEISDIIIPDQRLDIIDDITLGELSNYDNILLFKDNCLKTDIYKQFKKFDKKIVQIDIEDSIIDFYQNGIDLKSFIQNYI